MKQLICMLVFCLIGFTGMSKGVETEKQLSPPEFSCDDLDVGTVVSISNTTMHATTMLLLDYRLSLTAIVPELAVNLADVCTYVLPEAVIKPPGTLANIQATPNSYNDNNARDWVTHRTHLNMKTNFMLNNFIVTPTAFD